MQSEIERWGNSAAVRLSSEILAEAQLGIASPIHIEAKPGKIVISGVANTTRELRLPFSETELLVGLGAYGAHADEMAQPSSGEMGG